MKPDLKSEHDWLKQFVGEWDCQGEAPGPDGKTMKWEVRETGRMIGDAWLALEGVGNMPDSGDLSRTIMTLGYDPAKGKFVGTFIGSMMTHLWVYSGALDADRRVLT